MKNKIADKNDSRPGGTSGPELYKIIIKGHLEKKWSNWFEGMKISLKGPNTILIGALADQSALHGLLVRIRDLNLPLLLVEKIEKKDGDRSSLDNTIERENQQ